MKLAILVSVLAMQAAAPGHAPAPAGGEAAARTETVMPNIATQPPGCLPLARQVQDEADRRRDREMRTLDREPPAHLLRAVDRQVGGCREPTFVHRNIAPAQAFPRGAD